jgi:hypothetical protein
MLYMAGYGANGKWVEKVALTATSIGEDGDGYKYMWRQASLQQKVGGDRDARVVMKDDAELDTYSMSAEVHQDSDAMVVMKDDGGLDTHSQSGDETKVKSSILGEELGIFNMVGTEDERYMRLCEW